MMRLNSVLFFILTQVLVFGCTHTAKEAASSDNQMQRAPASVPMDQATLQKFDELFRLPAGDAFLQIRSHFEGYLASYLRGQTELSVFDQRLSSLSKDSQRPADADALADSSYIRLLARHVRMWEQRHQLQMIYARLTDLELDRTSNQEDRIQARKIRLQTHRYLKEQGRGPHILAFAPLILDFHVVKDISVQNPMRRPAISDSEPQRRSGEIDADVVRQAQRTQYMYEQYGPLIQQEAQAIEKTPDVEDEQKMMAYQAQLERDLRVKLADRVTQAQLFAPDKKNVLTGAEFAKDTWALTYGDGPADKDIISLVEEIKKRKYSATFFFVQNHLRNRPNLLGDLKFSEVTLGSHSYTHANLSELSSQQQQYEVRQSLTELSALAGSPVKYFRSPYGIGLSDPFIRKLLTEQNAMHIHWNVDALDWIDSNPQTIADRIRKQMQVQGRGIIYFHDVRGSTVDASRKLFARWAQDKTTIKSMDDAISELNAN